MTTRGKMQNTTELFHHAQHVGVICLSPREHQAAVRQALQCNCLNIYPLILSAGANWWEALFFLLCSGWPFAKPPTLLLACFLHLSGSQWRVAAVVASRVSREMTSHLQGDWSKTATGSAFWSQPTISWNHTLNLLPDKNTVLGSPDAEPETQQREASANRGKLPPI